MAMNKDYVQRDPPDDEIYEEVNTFESPEPGHYSQYGNTNESSSASSYAVSNSAQISDESQNYHTASESEESGIRHQSSSYENNYHGLDPAEKQTKVYDSVERKDENEIWIKTRQFKSSPKEFIASFKNSKNEMRTDEETFIIVHLLGRSSTKSPVLDGRLDHLAMLACCDSPHVVKRALDILLNEIFLSISDSCTVRCYKILEAEEILRVSLPGFLKLDHFKAKCHRMTTYAWLITFVFLKCNVKHFTKIQAEMKQFDKILHALQDDRKNNERNIFRYGIYLARESIKQIIHSCGKKDFSETLRWNIKKCETLLHGKLEGTEVLQLGRDLRDGVSWIDLHVCLVFLQDLPKFYNFHEDKKPVILIQMLVADYRKRSATMKYRSFLKQQTFEWLFEILVYHVMLRLIRTSPSKAITEQVLGGQHGCGGILVQPLQSKSKKSKQVFGMKKHLKKLCQRAIFVAKPDFVSQFIEDNSSGDEEEFIEKLSILHLSSSYRDKIFEILQESRVRSEQCSVVTYDCQLSGRKCLLKLNYHSKEDLLESNALKTVALRTEIQILKVLNSDEEATRHIVQLFGSSIEAPIHMIIERTPKNDLLSYLQDISNPPQARALFKISLDICAAMVYLGKHAVIHRDLRAKNCIIFFRAGGDLVAKLGDFHLAVISYPASNLQESSNRRTSAVRETALKQFALRWMAIEVLQLCEFSSASDVWSFGILLSEIFTFGCKPYTNMRSGLSLEREEEVQAFILNGKRLELHPKIPEKIRLLIEYTMRDVDHRPTFSYLKDNLMNIMENRTGGELYDEPTVFWMSQKDQSYAGDIVKARSLALRFMAAHPFCVRAIPYKNDDETQRSFTMCLYVDNDGNEIPKKFEEDSQKVFAGYNIEYCDLQELARCKLVTQLPVDKRSCTQELRNLTKTIEENLHIFENRLNVTAVQASYKIENNIEKDISCVTVYVLGKGRIPVGETGVMAIKAFADYPFDVVEGYHQSCIRPEKSYVYALHAGVGIGIKSAVLLGSEVEGYSVVGNGVDSSGKIKMKDNTCDGMGNGHETVGELTNVIEGDVGNGVKSDRKIRNGHESFHEEGIECENFGELEKVVEGVGRLGITMDDDGKFQNSIKTDNGVGTLGGFLEDENGTRYILSCQHVLCPDENGNKAEVIVQPAQCDYNDEVTRAKEMIKCCTDQLVELKKRREMIEENNHVEIERNENQKQYLEEELNKNKKTVQNIPRVIGKYCDGLKQNEDFQSTDGSCKKIYVDAAFARLEPDEISKIEFYKETDPKCSPVVGFETMVLKEKVPFIPTGEIVDSKTFSEQLEKTPEPNFWKIGRTTGVTYGKRETNLFQNDHAYKRKICAGDLSVVPTSVFCCDCKELTDENQVDVSCIDWPVYCAICSKEIGKEPSPSWTSAFWKYNCLTVKTPMKEFCEQGDSGALVFDDSGRAWGILSGQFSIPRKNARIGLVVPLCVALQSLGRRSGKKFKLW